MMFANPCRKFNFVHRITYISESEVCYLRKDVDWYGKAKEL